MSGRERAEAADPDGVELVSIASADLLLSLRVPGGWEARILDEAQFGVFGDPGPDDYRPSLTFLLGEPEQPGTEWFSAFCRAAPGRLAQTLPGYELLSTQEFRLSSRALVFVVKYRQHAPGLPATSHLQAYIWAHSYRMYLADAATLRVHEDRDLPVFDAVLHSIRVLPERE